MFFKNFPTCTFISPCTSIRHTRVLSFHRFLSFSTLENHSVFSPTYVFVI
jgi:hypothetical protein